MKMYPRSGEKRRFDDIDVDDEEAIGALCRMSGGQPGDVGAMENEKRLRREIANSNERRRMQSINAGFNCLKQLLPHTDGEKLSKAAILQQTADYISQLEQDRKDLLSQNEHLKKILQQQESTDGSSSDGEGHVTDLLSTIQDLQQQGSPSDPATNIVSGGKYLSTSEFHKLNNNTLSKNHNNNNNSNNNNINNNNNSSIQLTSSKGSVVPQQGGGGASPPRVMLDTKALGTGGRVLLEEEDGVVTFRDDGKAFSLATADGSTGYPAGHYRMDVNRIKRRRTSLEEKVKTLGRYPVIKNKLDCGSPDQCVKNEPLEYSPVLFGLEEQVTKVVATGHSTVLQSSNGTRCYTINAHNPNVTAAHHPSSTTIVTILPPTPPHPNSMSAHPISLTAKANKGVGSVLETVTSDNCRITEVCSNDDTARCSPRVEVELASRIPTPDEIEYIAGESPSHPQLNLHHDGEGYGSGGIVVTTNQANNGCQKSLDTICEAIRHLEGDMFSGHDDTNAIEEEIITEETFPIQDTSSGQHHLHHDDGEATYNIHGSVSCPSNIVRHTKEGVYEICGSPSVTGPHTLQQQLQLYPSNGLVYGIDEHIVSSEPQEVPLELTTSHRIDRTDSPPPPQPSPRLSHSQGPLTSSNFIQASRPGVIVVKQA